MQDNLGTGWLVDGNYGIQILFSPCFKKMFKLSENSKTQNTKAQSESIEKSSSVNQN